MPRSECAAVSLADVSSANIVGYNTLTLNKEYTLLTVNFEKTGGGEIGINEAFPFTEGMTCAIADSTADMIQVMNDAGDYDMYFLSNGHYGKGGASFKPAVSNTWVSTSKSTNPETTTDTLAVGKTFWYLSRKGAAGESHSITVAGQVSTAEKEEYVLNKEYTLIGCPFPCEVAINGGIEVDGATCAIADSTADMIQIMTATGDYNMYYLSNGHYGKGGASFKPAVSNTWVSTSKSTNPESTTDKFPVGGGAWYLSRSQNGKIKFINPIGK